MTAAVQTLNQCWLSRWRQCCSLPLSPAGQFLSNRSWTTRLSGISFQGFLTSPYCWLLYPVSSSTQWAGTTVLTSHCVHRAPPVISRSWRFLMRSPCGAGGRRAGIGEGSWEGRGAAGMWTPLPPSALLRLNEALLLLAHRFHLCVGWVTWPPAELHGWPPARASL